LRSGYLRTCRWCPEQGSGPLPTTRKEAVVSFADKFRDKAQELRGRIRRNTGEVTGDRGLQAEGRADEVMGNLRQAGEKIKDAFRGRGTRRRRY
jgi:uncharacterized protein YjbJ (UPF0337 family)